MEGKLLLFVVLCAKVALIAACTEEMNTSGDGSVAAPVCDYCLSDILIRSRVNFPGKTVRITATSRNGTLETSAQETSTRKWRIICPHFDSIPAQVHSVVEGVNVGPNDYIQLNARRFLYNESCGCNHSAPVPYFTKHSTVKVIFNPHHRQAAFKVHYICLSSDRHEEITRRKSEQLLGCKHVVEYALKNATFEKLAQLILDPLAVTLAFQDPHGPHCEMMRLATAHCNYDYREITCSRPAA